MFALIYWDDSDLLKEDSVVKDGELGGLVAKVGLRIIQPLQPQRLHKSMIPPFVISRDIQVSVFNWRQSLHLSRLGEGGDLHLTHLHQHHHWIGLDWIGLDCHPGHLKNRHTLHCWDLLVKGELVELHGAVHIKVDPGGISG